MRNNWVLLFVLLLALLLLLPDYNIAPRYRGLIKDFGVGLVSAFVLGITLEVAFATRIAKDVFETAFGYLLPAKIRDETRWLTGLDRLESHSVHEYQLSKHSDTDKVIVLATVTREIECIGPPPAEVDVETGIQMRLFPGDEPRVLEYSFVLTRKGKTIRQGGLGDGVEVAEGLTQDYIQQIIGPKSLELYEDDVLRIRYQYRFTAHKNDMVYTHSATAALKPRIIVHIDPALGIEHRVKFVSRHQGDLIALGGGEYVLPALLLPSQAVRVRWWDPNDFTDGES
jgi:hypothetical protein